MKKKSLIKILISIVMLLIVFSYVDLNELKETLLGIPPSVVLVVILLYVLGQFISSYKWWLIASTSIDCTYRSALRAYFIGMYMNCFGLGTVGGDVARGVLLAGGKGVKTEALASVIADRAHGLAILSLIGILSVFALEHDRIDFSYKLLLIISALVITAGWFLGPKILLYFTPQQNRFRNKVERVAAQFPQSFNKLIAITVLSIIFHVVQIIANGYMAHSLGMTISWAKIFAVIPFVNILGTLPISWQGLGVRESSLLFFLSGYISSEQAIAMGALWFLAVTVSSAIGGVVAAMSGDLGIINRIKADSSQPESS